MLTGRSRRSPRTVALLAIVSFVVLQTWGPSAGASPTRVVSNSLQEFDSHIDHIIFLIMENHAYDNYFGTYCQKVTKFCPNVADGIPNGTCVRLYPHNPNSTACEKPYAFNDTQLSGLVDIAHGWASTHNSINGGAMNGFYVSEGSTNETFGHYTGRTIPVYWDMAEQYGLADDFFSSAASWSLPNHWFAVSAVPPALSFSNGSLGSAPVPVGDQYLNQSNQTFTIESELLNDTNVSWKWYDGVLPTYANAQHRTTNRYQAGRAFSFWSPLDARAQSYLPNVTSHFVNRTSFYGDALNGTLPNISWIVPFQNESDHPPYNVTAGQDFVASIVDALEASPEWNSSVLFLTWDEYGGFYDHVAPPIIGPDSDGIRVPMIAIGPWVRQGFVDHVQMNFDSILHLMEKRFGLACMGSIDCNATLPLTMFNYGRGPRAPIGFEGWANASYPMPLESSGRLPPPDPFDLPYPTYASLTMKGPVVFAAQGGIG